VRPYYVNATDPTLLSIARELIEVFHNGQRRTRGEVEFDIEDLFGNDPGQLLHQGLTKLLEDRCEFEVASRFPPEDLRDRVFRAAAVHRAATCDQGVRRWFDRPRVVAEVAQELGTTPDDLDQDLFADLKSEQRLVRFKNTTPDRLLARYNVALAQAVLLRSTQVRAVIRGEPPRRYRQLLRMAKFHRLICEVEALKNGEHRLLLDGPLSLFTSTQRYGLQLAMFLPAILLCRDFAIEADLLWGPQRKPKRFRLTPADGLVSHLPDTGTYLPDEMKMFLDLFRAKVADWDIDEESEILSLGAGYWVPDFRLIHRETKKTVYLEVLGFWRRTGAQRHLERLRAHSTAPFLLAVSDSLRIDDGELDSLSGGIHRFRQMPLPEEIARLANDLVASIHAS
jgi:predicted nuclease of restriction endonuclease-like RecB superfamily